MKDKAYKLGLTVPQYVQLMQKHYRRKHRLEILGIIFFGFCASLCLLAIAFGIYFSL